MARSKVPLDKDPGKPKVIEPKQTPGEKPNKRWFPPGLEKKKLKKIKESK